MLVLFSVAHGEPVLDTSERVRFVVLGDTGEPTEALFSVVRSAVRWCRADDTRPACAFGLLLGDNFYEDGVVSVTDPLWQTAFREPFAPFGELAGFRLYAVAGNHDWRAKQAGIDAQIAYSHSSANDQALWSMPAKNYEIPGLPDWLHVAGLDSVSLIDGDTAFVEALARDMARRRTGWNFAFAHHFVMSTGLHAKTIERDDEVLAERIAPLVDAGLDVLFSGHDHHQEILADGRLGQIIVGSSSRSRALRRTEYSRYSEWAREGFGFAIVDVTRTSLVVAFFDENGERVYEHPAMGKVATD